ncbi:MAG: glucose-1-phosphate thymidylyltransferase, partial [Firmicutes bacterium]|nr:glucose-1-phosphate thymidylyltransferase [Bacillota bacterium]
VVEPGALIEGPTVIGPRCRIRHGAYIRGHCWIGPDCVVGHATELKRVIMFPGAAAPHLAYVGDSILGRRVNLGAGVKTANLKNDRSEVVIKMGTERIPTGLPKFGAVIGDRTQLGCNCVTTPGTLIGPDSLVYPNVMLRGIYPARRIIKGRGPVEVIERLLTREE